MHAIYHVVEHFAMHYGQILYISKLLHGEDLGFYAHLKGPQQTVKRSDDQLIGIGGDDGARTRDLRRDRPAF
jgi:hypothetical protein